MSDEDSKILNCILCEEAFWIPRHDDYGDVLDHWAREHNDSETFWRVVGSAKTHARCAGCGEMFVSQIGASDRGLTVKAYCDECAENGLEDKVKALVVNDVTGRYVLENEAEEAEGCA